MNKRLDTMLEFLRLTKTLKAGKNQGMTTGCFGKLPIYDDFIRHNVTDHMALALDEWVQQGYAHYATVSAQGMEMNGDKGPIYHFIFSSGSEHAVPILGTLMGSRDRCGRCYPFVVFKIVRNLEDFGLIPALVSGYRHFFDSTVSLCRSDWSPQPVTVLKRRIDMLGTSTEEVTRRRLLESELESLRSLTKRDFWMGSLDGSDLDNGPYIVQAVKELLDSVVRKSPLRTAWGIGIPIPSDECGLAHVVFWAQVVEMMLESRGWRPHFIWGDRLGEGVSKLYVFFRPVAPSIMSYLLSQDVTSDIVIDVAGAARQTEAISDTAKRIGSSSAEEYMIDAFNEWSEWRSA